MTISISDVFSLFTVIKVGPLAAYYQVPLRHILLVGTLTYHQVEEVNDLFVS